MRSYQKAVQPLRVLFLTTSYPLSGAATQGVFIRNLAVALSPHAEVTVLSPHFRGAPRHIRDAGVEAIAFRYAPEGLETLAQGDGGIPEALRRKPWRWALTPSFLFNFWVRAAHLGRRTDLIHAHWAVTGWLAIAGRAFHRRPVVTTLRGSDELLERKPGPLRYVYRQAMRGSARITAVNQAFVAGRDPIRYRFIPNGVDAPVLVDLHRSTATAGGFRFLFVGSLIERKRVEDLLRAFSRAGLAGQADIYIVGDGPLRGFLEGLCETLELRGAVHFEGSLPHAQALRRIGESDCLVLPSSMEGRPNVVLEAMAAGRPVIASEVPGTLELVRHGKSGLTYPVGDVDTLARHMAHLRRRPEWARDLGRAGRAWIAQEGLTWEACASQYLELYREVVSANRG